MVFLLLYCMGEGERGVKEASVSTKLVGASPRVLPFGLEQIAVPHASVIFPTLICPRCRGKTEVSGAMC